MAKEINTGTTKRFGARYGRKTKKRFGIVEAEQRKLHKCPYCNAVKVKRVALGIWNCRKCGVKFTGRAYSIKKEARVEELPGQKILEKKEPEEDDSEEELSSDDEEEVSTEEKEEVKD
ncbi:MAG: 50S ribosomal protein L37ae [Nanoarchaeota archaeon]